MDAEFHFRSTLRFTAATVPLRSNLASLTRGQGASVIAGSLTASG